MFTNIYFLINIVEFSELSANKEGLTYLLPGGQREDVCPGRRPFPQHGIVSQRRFPMTFGVIFQTIHRVNACEGDKEARKERTSV